MLKQIQYKKYPFDIVSKLLKIYHGFANPMRVAIDMGSEKTRIAILSKGIVLREATYIGMSTKTNDYIFFGDEAKEMHGKTPNFIEISRPIQHSILSDFDGFVALMEHFLKKAVLPYYKDSAIFKAGLIGYTIVPSSATEVEQKATREALKKAGFSAVHLIEKSYCNALSAKSSLFTNTPIFVVDLGGGTVEMALLISGGIVCSKVLKIGGTQFDKQILHYIHLKYGIIAGDQSAELLKNTLLSFASGDSTYAIRGKSLETGLPKSAKITTNDIREAVATTMNTIVDGIKEVIETIPPDIIDAVVKQGIVLTGNLAIIPGIANYISKDAGIPVYVSESPELATLQGLMKLIRLKERSEKLFF
ncbi:MAG: rod shape-determining protein [Candidatus Roizmanbacteria bacterium]